MSPRLERKCKQWKLWEASQDSSGLWLDTSLSVSKMGIAGL